MAALGGRPGRTRRGGALLSAAWHVSDRTLREVVTDPAAVQARLDAIGDDPQTMGERVGLLRMLGRLDDALELARAHHQALLAEWRTGSAGAGAGPAVALDSAAETADRADVRATAAAIRLAHVHHWRGEYAVADALLTSALSHAGAHGHAELVGFALQHRAKSRFDAGDLHGAIADITAALQHRRHHHVPADQLASSEQAYATIAEAFHRAFPDENPPSSAV